MALNSVGCASMKIRALCHDHFQKLSSSRSHSVSVVSNNFSSIRRTYTLPLTGLTRCIFSQTMNRVSCSRNSCIVANRIRSDSWVRPISAQPTESTPPAFNEEDYEEREETEEQARRRNWVENGWAPWEELLSPEAEFAVESLAPGEEEPVVSWESFEKLNPKWQEERKRRLEEEAKRKEIDKEPVKLEGSIWDQPLVFTLIPPRDWPPPGWKVDPKELAYIRESQALENVLLSPQDLQGANEDEEIEPEFPRWKMFLKQYSEWVDANKDRLDVESQEIDAEYYPGRRRVGENAATEGNQPLYELPFIYPGQHYWGVVSCVSLYEGAFVYFGGVHDGWVAIQDNDWYYIRDVIKVGMYVQVEVIAKRDPYRFRFPIEMRFVDPNIDDMIFRRFKHPPIFARPGDDELDEVARDSGRPYWPKPRPERANEEEEDDLFFHPSVPRLWQLHQAEQMVLDHEDGSGDDEEEEDYSSYFDDEDDEDDDDDDDDEEDEVAEAASQEDEETFEPQWLESVGEYDIPTLVLNTNEKDLNLKAARAEREEHMRLWQEAEARGEEFVPPKSRFECRVEELNNMHIQRRYEEAEALLRDSACRKELGLPLEEPGRYADKEFWGKNPYDPRDPRWRHDYWGDPSKLKDELRRDREPRTPRVDEAAVVEEDEDDLLEGKEEEKEELVGGDTTTHMKTANEDRGVVNGTATIHMDDVRGMFTMQPEDYTVSNDKVDELESERNQDDEDIAEGGGIDLPDSNR